MCRSLSHINLFCPWLDFVFSEAYAFSDMTGLKWGGIDRGGGLAGVFTSQRGWKALCLHLRVGYISTMPYDHSQISNGPPPTLLFEFRAFISVSVETGMINFNFAVRMINFNFAVRIPLSTVLSWVMWLSPCRVSDLALRGTPGGGGVSGSGCTFSTNGACWYLRLSAQSRSPDYHASLILGWGRIGSR